jgi:hypothetical protein
MAKCSSLSSGKINTKRRSSFQKTLVQTDGFKFCKFSWFILKFTQNAGNKFIPVSWCRYFFTAG